jgi:uncharacterized phiE125 gp8 family phage protein
MSVASTALITLAEAKLFPGLSTLAAADEAIVEALIDAASMDFEKEWDNYGIQRAVTEDYTYQEIKTRSKKANTIWLRKFPIVSVASITDPAGNTIDSDEYWIDKQLGALRTTGGWAIPQDTNGFASYWTIVYTAGRTANTAAVPANIKLACKMWTLELYKNPGQNVKSKSVGDLSITYKEGSGKGLPDQIKRMISCWKKVSI